MHVSEPEGAYLPVQAVLQRIGVPRVAIDTAGDASGSLEDNLQWVLSVRATGLGCSPPPPPSSPVSPSRRSPPSLSKLDSTLSRVALRCQSATISASALFIARPAARLLARSLARSLGRFTHG